MGESRKKVNAILRKVAEKAERAKLQGVTCPGCKTRVEQWWSYCAMCGWHIAATGPSFSDPPFACPPDEEAGK